MELIRRLSTPGRHRESILAWELGSIMPPDDSAPSNLAKPLNLLTQVTDCSKFEIILSPSFDKVWVSTVTMDCLRTTNVDSQSLPRCLNTIVIREFQPRHPTILPSVLENILT